MGQYEGGRCQRKSDFVNSRSANLDFFSKLVSKYILWISPDFASLGHSKLLSNKIPILDQNKSLTNLCRYSYKIGWKNSICIFMKRPPPKFGKLMTSFLGMGHSKVDMGQYEGGGVKNGQKMPTSFMDGPLE